MQYFRILKGSPGVWFPRTAIMVVFFGLVSGALQSHGGAALFIDVTQPPYNAVPNDGQDDSAAVSNAMLQVVRNILKKIYP